MRSKITKRNYSRGYPWPISEYLIWKMRRAVRRDAVYGRTSIHQVRTVSVANADGCS